MASILLAGLPYELESAVNRALAAQGHAVNTARDADQALHVITRSAPALAIVGADLTGYKGLHFCGHVRNIPEGQDLRIIFLTDRDLLADKLDGFAAGVDDYITIPFHMPELTLRVDALLRNTIRQPAQASGARTRRRHGPITLDRQSGEVWLSGRHVTLTPVEARLLDYLMTCAGRPVSAEELLRQVWDQPPGVGDPALVRVHIRHLRDKLDSDPTAPELLKTVSRRGYCLTSDGAP
ncbi:MAG: DNA-binding response regulator [Chloroflexi bacterium HGW-Chloroflexi-1]|nr:MAG: DNA-binding response regulator [Chloroflexi bacterium HGW-Chloroflexi-1]